MFRRNVRWTFRRNTYAIDVPGFQGAEPSGKFRSSPKAGSGAEWLATLRNLPVISPLLNQHQVSNIPSLRYQTKLEMTVVLWCRNRLLKNRMAPLPHRLSISETGWSCTTPMRSIGQSCAVSGTLYFFFALLIQHSPSANTFLPYFAVISAFLFLNHFPFLLKSIKIAVMNISLIFTNRNAITAITFFCYSVSVKLFLTVSLFFYYCYFILSQISNRSCNKFSSFISLRC